MSKFIMGPQTLFVLEGLTKSTVQAGKYLIELNELVITDSMETPLASIERAQHRGASLRAMIDPSSGAVLPVDLVSQVLANGSITKDESRAANVLGRVRQIALSRVATKLYVMQGEYVGFDFALSDAAPKVDAAPAPKAPAPASSEFVDDEAPFEEDVEDVEEVEKEVEKEGVKENVEEDVKEDAKSAKAAEAKLRADLHAVGYAGLKEMCVKHELPTHGKLNVLVDRLVPVLLKK